MAQDNHYKYLFIFIVPVTLYAVIINWWGLKVSRFFFVLLFLERVSRISMLGSFVFRSLDMLD